MLELTGMGSVLRGLDILYWLLAIGALTLAIWKGRGWRSKSLWALMAIAVFGYLPGKAVVEKAKHDAYAREAWAYFKKKCDTEAGEKIYKTFTGVKSVLVVKPLPPATGKDLYDQFWYGDPYSYDIPGADRGELAARLLIGRRQFVQEYTYADRGYDFVEMRIDKGPNGPFLRIEPLTDYPYVKKSTVSKADSGFGISWEDISIPEDRKYWVAGSRLRVINLANNSIVAERIGFLIEAGFGSTAGQRRPWMTTRGPNTSCPALISRDHVDRFFVLKVLRTNEGRSHGQ